MQTERREAGMQEEGGGTCPSCRAPLVAGMRFCRMCGYRLGEGVEEYVPTQRLGAPPPTATAAPSPTDPFAPRTTWGAQPIQPVQPSAPVQPQVASSSMWGMACAPKRAGWWTWIIIACVIMLGVGVGTKVARNMRGAGAGGGGGNEVAISFLEEVDGIDTADGGGAFIVGLAGPNSSLEGAGLIGGDIITHLDGKPVRDARALRKMIETIPPGKAVEVVYVRDGATAKTVLMTADKGNWQEMEPIDSRPGGRGVLGVDVGGRVRVPGSNIYGVELDGVFRNRPADLAGLQKGDIVVEFNGKLIRTPGDLRLRIYEAVPGSVANVVVMRDGQRVVIPVKVGRGKDE